MRPKATTKGSEEMQQHQREAATTAHATSMIHPVLRLRLVEVVFQDVTEPMETPCRMYQWVVEALPMLQETVMTSLPLWSQLHRWARTSAAQHRLSCYPRP
mmetsp:Transcript_121173/g.241370  ORF Transcript_121173/g.241370 Transcript_121173/m.241370 type:complete len:101 (-) Transcript_121173:1108-1410(-)